MTDVPDRNSGFSGRCYELDLVKILAVCEMIFMHLQENFFSGNFGDYALVRSSRFLALLDNFFYLTGPFSFMFSMGCTLLFSRHQDAAGCIRRGWKLLLAWLTLNLCRGTLWGIYLARSADKPGWEKFFNFLSVNDVLFFAGVFFLVFGLLRKRGLPLYLIVLTGAAGFVLASAAGDFGRLLPGWSHRILCGLIYIEHHSTFPLLNWFFVVCLGLCWGNFLRKGVRKERAYALAGLAGGLAAAGIAYGLAARGLLTLEKLRLSASDPLGCHHVNPVSLTGSASGLALVLSGAYFLLKMIPSGRIREGLKTMSSHIFEIYFIHWILLGVMMLFRPERIRAFSGPEIAGVSLMLMAGSVAAAAFYRRLAEALRQKKTFAAPAGKS